MIIIVFWERLFVKPCRPSGQEDGQGRFEPDGFGMMRESAQSEGDGYVDAVTLCFIYERSRLYQPLKTRFGAPGEGNMRSALTIETFCMHDNRTRFFITIKKRRQCRLWIPPAESAVFDSEDVQDLAGHVVGHIRDAFRMIVVSLHGRHDDYAHLRESKHIF